MIRNWEFGGQRSESQMVKACGGATMTARIGGMLIISFVHDLLDGYEIYYTLYMKEVLND